MRQPLKHRWLGILGLTVSLGCHHVHRECDCAYTIQPYRQALAVVDPPAPLTLTSTGPNVGAEPTVQPQKARKPKPPLGAVEVTAVAPSPTGGSCTGTLVLCGEDAEAMGVRPGYTPAAKPTSAGGNVLSRTAEYSKANPSDGD